MKNESEFKRVFKRSVSRYKGYSISLAAPVFPGIPDLYVVMPGYMPVLIEAKWMVVDTPKFNRKIDYRPMQLNYAEKVNSVQPYAMLGLIGVKYKKEIFAVLTDIHPTENRMSDTILQTANKVTRQGEHFDVSYLFLGSDIPLIEQETKASKDGISEQLRQTTGISDILRGPQGPVIASVPVSADLSNFGFMALPRQTS